MKIFNYIVSKLKSAFFAFKMSRFNKVRGKEPAPPLTALDELFQYTEALNGSVERLCYRIGDGVEEGLLNLVIDRDIINATTTLKFVTNRLRDEILIKVRKQALPTPSIKS